MITTLSIKKNGNYSAADSHRLVRLWRMNADRFKYKEITEEGELLKIED
jgi:hypothetical protein